MSLCLKPFRLAPFRIGPLRLTSFRLGFSDLRSRRPVAIGDFVIGVRPGSLEVQNRLRSGAMRNGGKVAVT